VDRGSPEQPATSKHNAPATAKVPNFFIVMAVHLDWLLNVHGTCQKQRHNEKIHSISAREFVEGVAWAIDDVLLEARFR
jgi:hypothetical protein